jgi:Nitrite and sulphite reductase 4Fe-4S domain
MNPMTHADVLVVGNGMVGHRFVEALVEGARAVAGRRVVVVGEERRRAYDRVHLSSVFDGVSEEELTLGDGSRPYPGGVELLLRGTGWRTSTCTAGWRSPARAGGSSSRPACWPPVRTRGCRPSRGSRPAACSSTGRSTTSRPSRGGRRDRAGPWCRYGVQDSVQLAVELELRYRGLQAPHKLKFAVSGCARECAEAQSKDVAVIATERGWNLYVGGNGGMRPAHGELLAEDLDTPTLVRTIDRYVMWYVRSSDRLERTASWQRKLPGGIDFVRRVVLDDELGIGAELEDAVAAHVAGYRCEWKETLEDPERLARFVSFVNSDAADPTIRRRTLRGQRIPVRTT